MSLARLRGATALLASAAVAAVVGLTVAPSAGADLSGTPTYTNDLELRTLLLNRSSGSPYGTNSIPSSVKYVTDFTALRDKPRSIAAQLTDRVTMAEQAGRFMPALRALGTIGLVATTFQTSYKITRALDTRYFHVGESIAGALGLPETVDGAGGPKAYQWALRTEQWHYWASPPAAGLPTGWYLEYESAADGSTWGGAIATAGYCVDVDTNGCAAHGRDGWNAEFLSRWRAAVEGSSSQVGHEVSVLDSVFSSPAANLYQYAWYASDAEMRGAAQIDRNEPWVDDGSQDHSAEKTVAYTVPSDVGSPADLAAARGVLDPSASAPAGYPAATTENAGAWINFEIDPTDYPADPSNLISVPDCRGLSQADCLAALEAAGLDAGATVTLGLASADVTLPAGAVVSSQPAAGAAVEYGATVTVEANPDPLPIELPQPQPNETYDQYVARLQTLGYLGTITATDLDETTGDGSLGPSGVPFVTTPATTVRTSSWPSTAPRVWPGDSLTLGRNPSTFAPASDSDCPCPVHGFDFSPLSTISGGGKFPFGIFGYATGFVGQFNVAPTAPRFTFSIPAVTVLGVGYDCHCDYDVNLDVVSGYMAIVRTLLSVAIWVGAVWYVGSRLLGLNSSGDPGAAVDDGMPL